MPTPRHISQVGLATQRSPAQETSEVAIGGSLGDPNEWILGTIEQSSGDLANRYELTLGDGAAVTASSVLDGTPLDVGTEVWVVRASGRALIVGLR